MNPEVAGAFPFVRILVPVLAIALAAAVLACAHSGFPETVPLTKKGRAARFAAAETVKGCRFVDEVSGEARGDSIESAVRQALNEARNLAGAAGANTLVYGETRYLGSWGTDAVRVRCRAFRCPSAPAPDEQAEVEAAARGSAEAGAVTSSAGPPPTVP